MPDSASISFQFLSPAEALSICAQVLEVKKCKKVSLSHYGRSASGINLCFDSSTVVDIYLPKKPVMVDTKQLSLAL